MKRICDIPYEEIKVGLRIRSLVNRDRIGTIVRIDDANNDYFTWIKWENEPIDGGFYWNKCECEIVESDL